jgi:mono/diheme cytochrome c family protein
MWKSEQRAGVFATLATAGGLLFVGNADRRFQAFDSRTGTLIWETVLNGPVTGHPIAYAVAGRQYIAVAAGGGDFHSGNFNALAGLPTASGANTLYVFALPQAPLARRYSPPQGSLLAGPAPTATAQLKGPTYTSAQAARGKAAYTALCARCHGDALRGGIGGPSLTGRAFVRRYGTHTVAGLYDVIWTTMPIGQGRSLAPQTVADIIAYWLEFDGQPAGTAELVADRAELGAYRLMPPR